MMYADRLHVRCLLLAISAVLYLLWRALFSEVANG